MNREKILLDFYRTSIAYFKQVSEPQYFQGEGPYFLAVVQNNDDYEFHGYEFVDAKTFLASPNEFSQALYDPDFLFQMADTLNLEIKKSRQCFFLFLRKVVPDTPASRLAVQELSETNPDLLDHIFLVNDIEEMLPATYVLQYPILLN